MSAIGCDLDEGRRALFENLLKKEGIDGGLSSTISRRKTHTGVPLSFAQEGLWFLGELDPGGVVYNVPMGLRLDGTLDAVVLRRSLEEVVRRHEALRTRFKTVAGRPVQEIEPLTSMEMPFIELSELPEVERKAEATRLCREEAQRPFDLEQDLMLRANLLRLEPTKHILFLNLHHIASDAWSVGVLLRELGILYEAFCKGRTSPLAELPIQYADFAAWQRNWLQGEVLETQLSYWKTRLAGAPALLDLPTDRSRPARQSYRGATETAVFPNSLLKAVKGLSQQEGASLFMTLLAAFQTLLSRYTGQEDILVGSPIAGRNRIELEGLIGFFVNTLVLRGDLSGNPTFRGLLRRMKEVTLGAYAHQDLPFEKLVEELQPERNLSYSPLVQVMFTLDNTSAVPAQLGGLDLNSEWVPTATSKFDLTMSVSEVADGLKAELEYSTDLFDAATVRRMLGHYQVLLEGIVADPDARIGELPLLTQTERHQLLVEWNQTEVDYPRDKCVHQLFEEQALRTPDAIAVVFEDQQLTYLELNERANQLTRYLQRQGVASGSSIVSYMERSPDSIVTLLATLKSGAAYVALDPDIPPQRLSFIVRSMHPAVIVVKSQPQKAITGLVEGAKTEGNLIVVCLDQLVRSICEESKTNVDSEVTSEDQAYVCFTSGSSGRPKGVVVPHRAIVRLVKNTTYVSLSASDVFLQLAPISFDASTFEIWACLLNGGKLVIFPSEMLSLTQLGYVIKKHGISVLWLTTGLFQQMVDHELDSLTGVRQLLTGGDVLSTAHVRKALERLGEGRLINGYGPTENTTFTCCHPITCSSVEGKSIPIGRPILNTQCYILDADLQPMPIGVRGELFAGGDGLALGYLNEPALTAEKFIPSPFGSDSLLYRTGDFARYRSDGNIEFLGRADQQVKIRGYRVELGEIESVLKLHPTVRDAAVVIREDVQGDRRVVVYVVPAGSPAQSDELKEFLKERLPAYMLPSVLIFIDAFPLTPNGKLDRRALPAPESATQANASEPAEAMMTPAECRVAAIWGKILQLERVGLQENFFDLGGHSLLLLQLHVELEREFSRHFALVELFQRTTVAAQAEWLTSDTDSDNTLQPIRHPAVVQLRAGTGKLPVYFIYAGPPEIGLAQMIGDGHSIFGIEVPWPLSWREAATNNQADLLPTMEQLIAPFVSILTAHVGATPCVLAGYSFAGLMAFESAHQLRRLGGHVELVILLDTYLKDPSPFSRAWYNFPRTWYNFRQQWEVLDIKSRAEQSVLTMRARLQNAWHVFWRMFRYRITRVLSCLSVKSDVVQASAKADFGTGQVDDKGVPIPWSRIERLYDKVGGSYMPRRLECRGILFRASQDSKQYWCRGDESRGWKNLFAKGVETVFVTGDHWTIGRVGEHQRALAARMTEVLDRYSSKDKASAEASS